ncbi:MAG: AraC family transcriptional regulator [Chloroflexi bacterium OLB14]|nr:MAG: AraC family transcriptional regulator [Chloroflexi bacterium OLB14]
MIFQSHLPRFPLNHYIESLFYYEGLSPTHQLDRFLPDGNTELIINLNEIPQSIHHNQTLNQIQICKQAWVSGVRTKSITIPSGKGNKMLVIAFRKGKAFPFYPLPMNEISDFVIESDLIFGQSILDLRERLIASSSISHMFLLTENFLLTHAGCDSLQTDSFSRCIDYALTQIIKFPNQLCLEKLSDEIGYSQKHFIHLFKSQVGLTPKQYMNVLRFQKAILEIESTQIYDWSAIAHNSGFYDQSHFIHHFKEFSGFTPNEYIKIKTDALNYVPVS